MLSQTSIPNPIPSLEDYKAANYAYSDKNIEEVWKDSKINKSELESYKVTIQLLENISFP